MESVSDYNLLWGLLIVPLIIICFNLIRAYLRFPDNLTSDKEDKRDEILYLSPSTVRIEVLGQYRDYIIHVPPNHFESPLPLVIAFHGGQGNGRLFALQTGFSRLARQEGFIVVYPNAIGLWNDGRKSTAMGPDDIAFTRALIDELINNYGIDRKRVYATGASNGGMMTLRLACELHDRIAAFAAVIASLPVDYTCPPGPPVPLMLINDVEDCFIPWEGGNVRTGFGRGAGGKVISVPDNVRYWQRRNGCGPSISPQRIHVWEKPSTEGAGRRSISVEIHRFPKCKAGAELVFLRVHGGGHTWLGGRENFLSPVENMTDLENGSIKATEMIWNFLRGHVLSG